jgi:hypothetical protein
VTGLFSPICSAESGLSPLLFVYPPSLLFGLVGATDSSAGRSDLYFAGCLDCRRRHGWLHRRRFLFDIPCVAIPLSPLLFVHPPFPVGTICVAGPLLHNAQFTPDDDDDEFGQVGGCSSLTLRALCSMSPRYCFLTPHPPSFFDRLVSPSRPSAARNSAFRSDWSSFADLFGWTAAFS